MANWVTHTLIAARLLDMGLELPEREFCLGNIAPDCNVENADWTAFEPPREMTHWMRGDEKDSADVLGFYDAHLRGRNYSPEERAFFIGYFAHLVTDVEFHRFLRSESHVAAMYERIKRVPEMHAQINGMPETFDSIKKTFGRKGIYWDINAIESGYIADHPDCMYNSVLRKTEDFPDMAAWLPEGAIARKIKVMTAPTEIITGQRIFVLRDELMEFIDRTCRVILEKLTEFEDKK